MGILENLPTELLQANLTCLSDINLLEIAILTGTRLHVTFTTVIHIIEAFYIRYSPGSCVMHGVRRRTSRKGN